MKLKLMSDYLAITVVEENTTKSGIIVVDSETEGKPQQGVVTHVGESTDSHFDFKVGQVVLFEKFGAIELKAKGETIHVIDKRDIVGILE